MAKMLGFDEAINKTIIEEMRRDPTIFIYGSGVRSKALVDEFGWERAAPSGICETQEAGAGIGAALAGMRPIVDLSMTDFALEAFGQVCLQAATIRFKLADKLPCPVVYKMQMGQWLAAGSIHHCGCYHNWMANAPCLLLAVPTTPADAVGLWRTALRTAKDPVIMLADRGVVERAPEGSVPDEDYTIPFGKADIKREGTDVTIAATGYMVHLALDTANDLAKEGISAEVWDPRTLKPFDRESLIQSVRKTGAMVAVDQANKSFGTTGEFAMTIAEALYPIPPMARVTSMDTPVAWAEVLEVYVRPSKEKITSAVKTVLAKKRSR